MTLITPASMDEHFVHHHLKEQRADQAQVPGRTQQIFRLQRICGRQAQLVRQGGGVGGSLVQSGDGAQGSRGGRARRKGGWSVGRPTEWDPCQSVRGHAQALRGLGNVMV